jgi:hypothetical protein
MKEAKTKDLITYLALETEEAVAYKMVVDEDQLVEV